VEAVHSVIAGKQARREDLIEELTGCMRRLNRAFCLRCLVEVIDCHAVAEEPVDSDVREELRIQVEPAFHESKAVEHYGLDDLSLGEVVLPRLGDGTVDDPEMPRVSMVCRRDDPDMAYRDVRSFDEAGRDGHTRGFAGKYKDFAV